MPDPPERGRFMKKKAVILSMEKIVCDYIKAQMDKLVGDLVDFSAYSLEEGVPGKIACDACIFPTEDRMSLNLIADKLLPGAKFLSVRRTLLNGEWHKLGALPYGTNALLVNTSKKLSLEAISFLLELGQTTFTLSHTIRARENTRHTSRLP